VAAVLRAQPGTRQDVAVYGGATGATVKVPGIAQQVSTQAFGGDASWLGYAMIAGRWYRAPGEVVVNTTFLTDSGLAVGDTATVDILDSGSAPVTVRISGEVFRPSDNPWLLASTQTLRGFGARQNLRGYDVGLRPGTSVAGYIRAVNQALGPHSPWLAAPGQGSSFFGLATSLVGLLAVMVAVAAGLGVLNTVLMTTRDRVHDLGIFKAIGMRPSQMLAMVVCWIVVPAVVAAAVAAPAAVALTAGTVNAMAGTAHTGMPASFTQVFPPSRLALLSLGALAIALAGALLPATWAARARASAALRAE
jgi:putative ABC transport system permease protein